MELVGGFTMKRAVFITLLLCLLIVAVASLVQAESEPLVITPYRSEPEIYTSAGREVIIRAGWGACTRGLAQASVHASTISMEIDYNGIPWVTVEPPSRNYWNQPESTDFTGLNACVMNTKFGWWTEWLYSLGMLEAGTYDVHFFWTFTHPIPDGGDYDGDGRPDIFSSENFLFDENITIFVE
jgi:hypothetical protein